MSAPGIPIVGASPGRRLAVGGLIVLGALAAGAVAVASPYLALAVLGVVLIALFVMNPPLSLVVLIIAAAANRVGVAWGDADIRVEIVVALLVAAAITNRLAVRTLSRQALRSPLVLPLVLYTAANIAGTLLFAVERTRGLKLDAEIIAAVITYVIVIGLLRRRADLELAIRALWIVTVAEACIGILAMTAYALHVTMYGVQMNETGFPMAYGTEWEANIFGSYLLGNLFVLLGDYVGGRRSTARTLGLIVIVAGIGVSMTRTVWLALCITAVVFVLTTVRVKRPTVAILPVLVAFPVVMLGGLILGTATPLAGRLLDLVDFQSSSASGRFTFFSVALQEWIHRPILGNGTGSFNYNPIPGQPHPWLPNLFLLTLHDAGILGLLALLAAIWLFYRYTWRALRADHPLSLIVAGSIAGFTGLMLAFQMTTGFWFAYPWIVTGIGVSAARLVREEQ